MPCGSFDEGLTYVGDGDMQQHSCVGECERDARPATGNTQAHTHTHAHAENARTPNQRARVVFYGDCITKHWLDAGAAALEKHFGRHAPAVMGVGSDQLGNQWWRLMDGEARATRVCVQWEFVCFRERGTCTSHTHRLGNQWWRRMDGEARARGGLCLRICLPVALACTAVVAARRRRGARAF